MPRQGRDAGSSTTVDKDPNQDTNRNATLDGGEDGRRSPSASILSGQTRSQRDLPDRRRRFRSPWEKVSPRGVVLLYTAQGGNCRSQPCPSQVLHTAGPAPIAGGHTVPTGTLAGSPANDTASDHCQRLRQNASHRREPEQSVCAKTCCSPVSNEPLPQLELTESIVGIASQAQRLDIAVYDMRHRDPVPDTHGTTKEVVKRSLPSGSCDAIGVRPLW